MNAVIPREIKRFGQGIAEKVTTQSPALYGPIYREPSQQHVFRETQFIFPE